MRLMGTIIVSLDYDWPLVLMSPVHFVQQPLRWLQAITDYRVSITVGPNFSLDMCTGHWPIVMSATNSTCPPSRNCSAEQSPIQPDTRARFAQQAARWASTLERGSRRRPFLAPKRCMASSAAERAMTLLLALAVADVTAWVIEWSQRQCENWCE